MGHLLFGFFIFTYRETDKIMKTNFALACLIFLGLSSAVNAQGQSGYEGKYILILNIQDHFTRKVLDENSANQIIENVNAVIDKCDPEKVIYMRSILSTLSISIKGKSIDTLPNLELDQRLRIVNQKIFSKSKPNAFTSLDLVNILRKNNITELVVVGLMADHCVYQTLTEGKKLGLKMYYVPEAIGAKTQETKEKILKNLEKKGIKKINL